MRPSSSSGSGRWRASGRRRPAPRDGLHPRTAARCAGRRATECRRREQAHGQTTIDRARVRRRPPRRRRVRRGGRLLRCPQLVEVTSSLTAQTAARADDRASRRSRPAGRAASSSVAGDRRSSTRRHSRASAPLGRAASRQARRVGGRRISARTLGVSASRLARAVGWAARPRSRARTSANAAMDGVASSRVRDDARCTESLRAAATREGCHAQDADADGHAAAMPTAARILTPTRRSPQPGVRRRGWGGGGAGRHAACSCDDASVRRDGLARAPSVTAW